MDYSTIPSISDLGEVREKRVLMRCDFNVPLAGSRITSDRRIRAALPSIRLLLEKGARLVLCSHLGRPNGLGLEPALSLDPVAKRLSELLDFEVLLAADCIGEDIRLDVERLVPGRALLLENLRFHAEEKQGDEGFGKELSSLAELYVNEAFGTCHRGDASMVWPAKLLKSAAGELVLTEVRALSKVLVDPQRPCLAVLGGAKVSDKIPLIDNLLGKVNEICIGGGMAYTFLKAEGWKIGNSLVDDDLLGAAKETLQKARELDVIVHLPKDNVCAAGVDEESAHEVSGDIPEHEAAFDIGPQTASDFAQVISRAKTILLNGPMGVFEKTRFKRGTQTVVHAIADRTDGGACSIVGGGDSASAVEQFGCADRMSHVSTGGGASLTLLQGGRMPALEVLGSEF